MLRRTVEILVWTSLILPAGPSLLAQVRVTPNASKGGEKQGEAWMEVPSSFRGMRIPDWPMPTDLKRWNEVDRARTRATLLQCLGELPPRPDPHGEHLNEHAASSLSPAAHARRQHRRT
jgi:hypothetical protein